MRRRLLLPSAAIAFGVLLATSSASAQTVTVDPANATPDNITTFSSLMGAIHSFQDSGIASVNGGVTTNGSGVGINSGNGAPNIINITSTATIDEIVRITERAASAVRSIHSEALTINGPGAISGGPVAPSAANNAVVATRDDGAASDDGFEIRSNINLTINNVTFMPSPVAPPAPGGANDLVTLDRLAASAGSPSTVTFSSCVFTTYNASNLPVVNSKTEALTNNTANIATPTTGVDDLFVPFPDSGEGMTVNLNDCIISHGSRIAAGSDGIVESGQAGAVAAGTDPFILNINSSIISYNARYGLQTAGRSNDANTSLNQVHITGTNAEAGPVAGLGGPTIILGNLRGWQSFSSTEVRPQTMSEVIVAGNTERQVALSANDAITMTGCLLYGPVPFVYTGDATVPKNDTITNTTIAGGQGLNGDAAAASGSLTYTNCVIESSAFTAIAGFGTANFPLSLDFTGYFAAGVSATSPATLGGGVFRASPAFVSVNPLSPDFLDVRNTAYATANSTSGPLAGGANYVGGVAPASITLTAPPSINFGTVSISSASNDTSSVSVANSGGADGIVGFARTGANPAEFTSSPTSVGIVPPAGLAVTVTFAPTLVQASTASLDITGDAVQSVALSGTGQVSDIHDWMAY